MISAFETVSLTSILVCDLVMFVTDTVVVGPAPACLSFVMEGCKTTDNPQNSQSPCVVGYETLKTVMS